MHLLISLSDFDIEVALPSWSYAAFVVTSCNRFEEFFIGSQ